MIIRKAELETVCGITSTLPENLLPEFAFAGKSNVGKSSLINGLLNRRALARTSSQPGKTQTINFYNVNDDLYFVDLPGYGYAKAAPETRRNWEGLVGGYVQQRPQLMGMVLVMDARRPFMPADEFLLDFLSVRPDLKLHLLLNKADQLKTMEKRQVLNTVKDRALAMGNHVSVQLFSGLKKEGVEQLQNVLCTWLNLPLGS